MSSFSREAGSVIHACVPLGRLRIKACQGRRGGHGAGSGQAAHVWGAGHSGQSAFHSRRRGQLPNGVSVPTASPATHRWAASSPCEWQRSIRADSKFGNPAQKRWAATRPRGARGSRIAVRTSGGLVSHDRWPRGSDNDLLVGSQTIYHRRTSLERPAGDHHVSDPPSIDPIPESETAASPRLSETAVGRPDVGSQGRPRSRTRVHGWEATRAPGATTA